MANKFQSVFDDCVEAEKQFDCMFGADEDDRLIEAVLTINEDAAQAAMKLPDDEELHQTDDNAKPKDLRDELGPNHDANKPTADSSDQEIIADDDDDILDLACPKFGVQDAVQKNDPDNTDITDEIDKAENHLTESLKDLLEEAETDLGDNEGLGEPGDLGDVDGMGQETDKDELEDNEDKNELDQMADPVNSVEECSLVEALLAECDDPSQCVAGEYTDPEDDMGEPDINNDAKAGAEGTDKDPVYEDAEDILDAAAGNCKDPEQTVDKEYVAPEDDMGEPDINNNAKSGAEGTDSDPVYESLVDQLLAEAEGDPESKTEEPTSNDEGGDPEEAKTEVEAENALVEALLREIETGDDQVDDSTDDATGEDYSEDDAVNDTDPAEEVDYEEENALVEALLRESDDLPEKVEDELIDDAEETGEMSDAEVDAIDDVYDDDLIDDIMGDD